MVCTTRLVAGRERRTTTLQSVHAGWNYLWADVDELEGDCDRPQAVHSGVGASPARPATNPQSYPQHVNTHCHATVVVQIRAVVNIGREEAPDLALG